MKNFDSLTPNNSSSAELLKNDFFLAEKENGALIQKIATASPELGEIFPLDKISGMTLSPANLFKLPQSFVALKLLNLVLGTPGSDAFVVGFPNKNDLLLARQGSDVLLAVDPGAENPGIGEIDTLAGDLDLFELFPLPGIGPQELIPRRWQDRFVLGDWQQPYYVGSGSNDYALILDFQPDLDIIQLHGTPENYQLRETPDGTELFWQQEAAEPDLIASLLGVFDLSLNDRSFQFKKDIPPPGLVVEEIEQLGTAGVDFAVGTDTNELGEVYLTGTSAGSFWVAKYDREGNRQWLKEAPSTGNIAADNAGNIYVGGGLGDVTLAKYDSEGNQLWERQFGSFTLDNSFNLDVDDFGNVYMTGYTLDDLGGTNASELAVGPIPVTATDPWIELTVGPIPVISTDSWIVKYDSEGNQQWLKQFGSGDFDEAFAITTDSKSNVYTSGWTFGDLEGTNAGLYDVWLAKHDSNGDQQWLKQFGSDDYDWAWDAATDNQDNVYVTGWTLGDLGGVSAGSYDGWVAKYNSNGDRQWIKQFGTTRDDIARSIDVDDLGNFYLTGYTNSDFGGSNTGSYDTWVAKYDSNGDRQWLTQFGSSEIDNPFNLAVSDNADEIFVTGFTEGSLGGTNAGSYDAWSAKLSSTDGSFLNFSQSSETASLLPDLSVSPEMLS